MEKEVSKKRTKKAREDQVIVGSDNVFADIGLTLSEDDAVKFAIAAAITQTIQSRKLTQVEAAEIVGIDQPKISSVVRGRLEGLSVDRLMMWLARLGHNVNISYSPVLNGNPGKVRVCG